MKFLFLTIISTSSFFGPVIAPNPKGSWKDFSKKRNSCHSGPCYPPNDTLQVAYSSDDDCARRIEGFVLAYNNHEVCNLKSPSSKTALDAALSWNAKKIDGSDTQITLQDEHGIDHVFPTFSTQHRCDVIHDVGYCSKTFLKQQMVGIFASKCPTHMVNSLPRASSSEKQKSECKYPEFPKVDRNVKSKGVSSSGSKWFCKDKGKSGW